MARFRGFPAGAVNSTPVPNMFFSGLLPMIDDLAELKVTLHFFWCLNQKKGFPRYMALRELLQDSTLLRGVRGGSSPGDGPGRAERQDAESVLRKGLGVAVARGTLLHIVTEVQGRVEDLYFLNTVKSREVVAKLRSGEMDIGQVVLPEPGPAKTKSANIFGLYEQNIGLLTPIIAEELADAEKLYPVEWIDEAFRLAVEYNKRNWRYINRILERWAVEGKEDEEVRRRPQGLFHQGLGNSRKRGP